MLSIEGNLQLAVGHIARHIDDDHGAAIAGRLRSEGARVGYLAQEPQLDPTKNVGENVRAAFATLDQAKTREAFLAAVRWLRARPDGNGKLGAVGFCYGGALAVMPAVTAAWWPKFLLRWSTLR